MSPVRLSNGCRARKQRRCLRKLRVQRQLLLLISRHFTVEEANALIPMLEPVMESLRDLSEKLGDVAREVQGLAALTIGNGHGEGWAGLPPEIIAVRRDVEQRLLYLQGIGVHVKDIEQGILDFPTRMESREVYLCWRLGEKSVAYWHELDAGYGGREPI